MSTPAMLARSLMNHSRFRKLALLALLLSLPAALSAGTAEGVAAFEAGHYEKAFAELKPAAEAGDAEAQYRLATLFGRGLGVDTDYSRAREWLYRASAQGHLNAMVSLGYSYSQGIGVPQDKAKAAEVYTRAAKNGSPLAQRNLGLMYAEGEGVDRDEARAARWFRRAAEQGDAVAQTELGDAYMWGDGVEARLQSRASCGSEGPRPMGSRPRAIQALQRLHPGTRRSAGPGRGIQSGPSWRATMAILTAEHEWSDEALVPRRKANMEEAARRADEWRQRRQADEREAVSHDGSARTQTVPTIGDPSKLGQGTPGLSPWRSCP
ncbi:MAG: tetratricopeptide repeat protein [Halofilum sp. (in: g-proteobacteria)]|nr:tetratricopeptide repeat protein [Halofilum sp. (in: g-proteobacteria)]